MYSPLFLFVGAGVYYSPGCSKMHRPHSTLMDYGFKLMVSNSLGVGNGYPGLIIWGGWDFILLIQQCSIHKSKCKKTLIVLYSSAPITIHIVDDFHRTSTVLSGKEFGV